VGKHQDKGTVCGSASSGCVGRPDTRAVAAPRHHRSTHDRRYARQSQIALSADSMMQCYCITALLLLLLLQVGGHRWAAGRQAGAGGGHSAAPHHARVLHRHPAARQGEEATLPVHSWPSASCCHRKGNTRCLHSLNMGDDGCTEHALPERAATLIRWNHTLLAAGTCRAS
jgi:hypothetical protein